MPGNSGPKRTVTVTITVNGTEYTRRIPSRMLLVHFLRDELGLTGTKIGCETSTCGCCTVQMDDDRVKSCCVLTVQADGRKLTTIEGISDESLSDVQSAFTENHALQCGYCTAGMIMSATSLLEEHPAPSRDEIKRGLAGNLCRCTGYRFIIDAVKDASNRQNSGGA